MATNSLIILLFYEKYINIRWFDSFINYSINKFSYCINNICIKLFHLFDFACDFMQFFNLSINIFVLVE